MRNKVLKNILIVMMLLAGHGLFSGIRMERFKNGATDCIGIENEYYSIVLVPDYGGRIFKWKNKISGITFTDEEIPDKPGLLVDQTGILDDRGNFRSIRYSAFPFSSRKDVIVLYLKGVDPRRKLTVERKMTFRSGSPVMDADGCLVGLAFDGNWESMSSDVMFEPDLQRCICVDIRYVFLMMDKFGGAGYLLDEMNLVR